jgi:hypothetical protein
MILLGINIVNMWILLERIRTRHVAVWVSLGKPKLFQSATGLRALFRFIGLQGEFKKLNDRTLSTFVYIHRISALAFLAGFIGLIIFATQHGR